MSEQTVLAQAVLPRTLCLPHPPRLGPEFLPQKATPSDFTATSTLSFFTMSPTKGVSGPRVAQLLSLDETCPPQPERNTTKAH